MANLLSDPTIPDHDHAVWCRAHDNGGRWDQVCATSAAELMPAGRVVTDPGTIRLALFQAQVRHQDDADWTVEAPRIQMFVFNEGVFAPTDVSLAEARRLAAELLNLTELGESETARCAR